MKTLKGCFFVLVLFAVHVVAADTDRRGIVFPAERVVLQPINIPDAQKLEVGYTQSGEEFVCFLAREADFSLSIRREGVAEPLLHQGELPAGFTLSNAYSCRSDEVVFLAVQQVQNQTVASVFLKRGGQVRPLLESSETQFSAFNPRTGQTTEFTYWHTYFYSSQAGRFVVLSAASPSQTQGVPGVAPPQRMYLELPVAGGSPVVLFNNTVGQNNQGSAIFHFTSQGDFCATQDSLYVLGQVSDPAPPTKSAVALYRIENGQSTLLKPYFQPTGNGLKCTPNGVQVYEALPNQNGVQYLYLADGSSSWQVLFTGNQLDGLSLSSRDQQFPNWTDELLVLSNARHIVRVAEGGAGVLKLQSQAPRGIPVDLLQIGERVLYTQAEGGVNRTYRMYRPRLTSDTAYGLPGSEVVLRTKESVIEGRLPTLILEGFPDVAYSPSTDGTVRFTVPLGASGQVSGIIEVFGIQVPFTLIISAPRPMVLEVSHVNYETVPLVPGSHFSIFGENFGCVSEPGFGQAAFELCGTRVFVGGKESRLYYVSGPLEGSSEQINAAIPQDLEPGQHSVQVVANGETSESFAITLVEQNFRNFTFLFGGELLPIFTNQDFQLTGEPALGFLAFKNGDAIIAWGSGGGNTDLLVDDRLFAPTGLYYHRKPVEVKLNGEPLSAEYSGRAPGFASLDQVVILLPGGTAPGKYTLTIDGVEHSIWLE